MTKKRIWFPGARYHIMSRGNRKEKIFLEVADYKYYLALLEKAWRQYDFKLYGYCLMPNHLHLQVKCGETKTGEFMHFINANYARYFNRKYDLVGHVFQGRYKSRWIQGFGYDLRVSRYIHLNPVEGGLVPAPENYRWSSYYAYLDYGELPVDHLVSPEVILEQFAEVGGEPLEMYVAYVNGGE